MEEREDSEDDQFVFSRAPRMPADDIIMSEVAVLTGGRDQHGRPIIAFPAKYQTILESKVKASGMDCLLRYFIDITRVSDRKRGFAFVTDLRFCVLDFILLMKSLLNSIQAEMKGAIGTCVLYAILPLNKKTHKDTLTHLALRESKKKSNKNIIPPYFQSVPVDDEVELYNYIEKSHLTPDLGGYLQYSHQEWVVFRRSVEPFFANFESVQVRLSNAYQRLTAMGNINPGNNKQQLQRTHNQLQDAYYDLRRQLQLDVVLDQCEGLLARFSSCDEEDVFTLLAQKPIFKDTKETVEGCHKQLVAAKKKIEEDWDDMSGRITRALQLIEYREDVSQLLDWFNSRKGRDLAGGADIAENLSRAEMLCNHFETGLGVKTEEKLSKAYDVVHHGERLAGEMDNRSFSEITQLTKTLNEEAQDFQNAVEKHQHILQSVYQFHQLYNKARRWYISCIKFLPSDLYDLYNDLRSQSRGRDHQALKLQWEEDVRRFLQKQPLLAKEELKKVKGIPEDVGATSLRKKGRLLSYRCQILINLLNHNEKTSSANIKDVLKWQSEIQLRSDDSASQQSEIPPSSDQMRKTPSDSSLNSGHRNQRHKKTEGKGRSKNSSKKTKNEDLHQRGTQSPERTRRQNGPRETSPHNHSNTVDDTNIDDPLLQRLGHPDSFYMYDRYGDTQGRVMGEGYNQADGGRDDWEDAQRNKHSEGLPIGAIEYVQQSSPLLQAVPANQFVGDRSQSRQSASEHGQTFGIYGDSDVEDDSAVIIHHQGPSHPPQGLPEYMLPGNQMLPQGHPRSGSHHFEQSSDPSNVSFSSERLSYGLIQDPSQIPSGYADSRQTPQLGAYDEHPQNGHTFPHATLHIHHNETPVNFNTNNNSSLNSVPVQSHLQGNHAQPRLSPSHVNGMTSPKRSPMSFHGSLMNIHQSHLDDDYPAVGRQDSYEGMNSVPVTRHRSLMNLSHSPVVDQTSNGSVQYNSMQTSPVRSDPYMTPSRNRLSNASLHNGEVDPTGQGTQNPYSSTSSRMKHGVSEPSVNLALHDTTSPYGQVLANLVRLQETNTRPIQSTKTAKSSRLRKPKTLASHHSLSRSEIDLRHIPQSSSPNSLSYSQQALHHSGLNHGQISSNSHRVTADPSAVLASHDASVRAGVPDPQVEYYKKLYSSASPKNHFTTASGHRKTDHTLDPSTHTWMHDIPSTHTRHPARLSDLIPKASPPLSPLALLEMEVANETMDAEEAIKEDEYEEEQMRRQVVIDSILNQSESSNRSRDVRGSQDKVSFDGIGHHKPGQRQKRVVLQSSPRKADENVPRKASRSDTSGSGSRHYSPMEHNARETQVTSKFNKTRQLENGWNKLDPGNPTAPSGIHHSTPSYTQRQSGVTPRGLSRAERQLGLSTTLPQEGTIHAVIASDDLQQTPRLISEPVYETADHIAQVYGNLQRSAPLNTSGASFGKPTSLHQSYRPGIQNEQVDWREEHLRELGLPPRIQHPVLNGSPILSKQASQPESTVDWRQQHLQDRGITSSLPHPHLRYNPTRSETKDSDWRSQHLTELGLSPRAYNSTPTKVPAAAKASPGLSDLNKNWRRQHLLELGISPTKNVSVENLNGIAGKNTPVLGSKSPMRYTNSRGPGISPRLNQYPLPHAAKSGVSEGNVAPMTSRLRGVLESGQSLDDMDAIHQLAAETEKKSVRFAHLSEKTTLDAEEQAQEELADRLHQLELKLQEEEYSLMYKDELDGEKASLDQQLMDLNQQEEAMLGYTDHQQTSPRRLQERDARQSYIHNGRRYQQMVEPVPQGLHGGALRPQPVRRKDFGQQEVAVPGRTRHQGMREGALLNGHRNQQIDQLPERVPQLQHIKRPQRSQVSQLPDKTVLRSPVKSTGEQNSQQNQVVVRLGDQEGLEEVIKPMGVQSSQRVPFTEQPGQHVIPDNSLQHVQTKIGQTQRSADQHSGHLANPESAETTKQVRTTAPFTEESKHHPDRLSSKMGSADKGQSRSPGTVGTPEGLPLRVTDRQSDRLEHQPSHGEVDAHESMGRINMNVAHDKPPQGQNLTKHVSYIGRESTDTHDHSLRAAQGEDEHSASRGGKVVTDQVVVSGRPAAASETKQNRDLVMVGGKLVRIPAGSVSLQQDKTSGSVLQDNRNGVEHLFLSEEELHKSTGEPNAAKKSVYHPSRNAETLDELVNKPAGQVSSRHTKSPADVVPDSRIVDGGSFPGEKELNQSAGVLSESEKKSVTHPTNIPQAHDNSNDLKKAESHSDSNEMMYESDDVFPNEDVKRALLSERDHTAADYIACALGMDYVNKKSLTVQPYSNSSESTTQEHDKHVNHSQNQDYAQSNRSHTDKTQDIKSPSQNDSRLQRMDSENAVRGIGSSDKENIRVSGSNRPHVNLPKTQVTSEDGPCSPLRKLLKEKETSEVNGIKSSQSEPNLMDKANDESAINHRFAVESPINAVRIENPLMSSQSTSPIRQWLREKQENEAHQSRESKDFASPSTSVIDGGLGNTSNKRPNTTSGKLDGSWDLKEGSNTRQRSHSLIPVPVGSKRADLQETAQSQKQSPRETRRRSSSGVPVYKGLSKSSPPRETSPSVNSLAGGKSPDTDYVTPNKMDSKSKKSSPYSKIPVKKVFTALKDGGYIQDKSQEQKPPQKVPPSKKSPARHTAEPSKSEEPGTQQSKPVLERRGTFTKESRPTLTREGTFTIEDEDDKQQTTEEKKAQSSMFSPLALVLDHMVKKGSSTSASSKQETSGGRKHHDSAEETFENSSTESSMSPTTKSTVIATNKPTTNLNSIRNFFVNFGKQSNHNQGEVTGSKTRGPEVSMDTYEGLTESDRKEHDDLDESELEKMMVTKSQLAEIRNLEIENRHLAYERKEFEAHLLKNLQHEAHPSDEG